MRIQTLVESSLLPRIVGGLPPYQDRKRMALNLGAKMARAAFARNFNMEGRPEWQQLAASTIKEKLKLYSEGIIRGRNVKGHLVSLTRPQPQAPGALFILVRSGALKNSAVRRGVAGNITRINVAQGTMELGTNIFYGLYHQEGRPGRNLPARPFLSMTDAEVSEMMWAMAGVLIGDDKAESTE